MSIHFFRCKHFTYPIKERAMLAKKDLISGFSRRLDAAVAQSMMRWRKSCFVLLIEIGQEVGCFMFTSSYCTAKTLVCMALRCTQRGEKYMDLWIPFGYCLQRVITFGFMVETAFSASCGNIPREIRFIGIVCEGQERYEKKSPCLILEVWLCDMIWCYCFVRCFYRILLHFLWRSSPMV